MYTCTHLKRLLSDKHNAAAGWDIQPCTAFARPIKLPFHILITPRSSAVAVIKGPQDINIMIYPDDAGLSFRPTPKSTPNRHPVPGMAVIKYLNNAQRLRHGAGIRSKYCPRQRLNSFKCDCDRSMLYGKQLDAPWPAGSPAIHLLPVLHAVLTIVAIPFGCKQS